MRSLIIGDQTVQILSFNPKRVSVIIFNVGNADVWLNENQEDPVLVGIPVPAGGCLILKKAEGDKPERMLYGRCANGLTTELRIWEIYE